MDDQRINADSAHVCATGGAPPADQCALAMMVLRYETCGHCGAALLPPEAPRHCHDCVLDEDDLMRFEAAIEREVGP